MKKVLPVFLAFIFIVAVGAAIVFSFLKERNSESQEYLNYAEEMELSSNEYTVTIDNELKKFRAVELDGRIYLDFEHVISELNSRFYWDSYENILIYTKAVQSLKAYPDEAGYHVGEEIVPLDYTVVKVTEDDIIYVALDYVLGVTHCEAKSYNNPNRLVLYTQWGETEMIEVKEDTAVRYRGGIKSEILRDAKAGEKMTLIDSLEDWVCVMTDDGYLGWMAKKYLGETSTVTAAAPDFEEEVFTSLTRDYKINLTWHQVMTAQANSTFGSAVENTTGINVISPTWFSFSDTEGTVASIASHEYVQAAHERGMEVWGLFSNEFPNNNNDKVFSGDKINEVMKYTSKREYAISQIISYALEYGLDGINLDFEYILEEGGENFIQFVRELSVQCRLNNLVFSIDNYVPTYSQHYNRKEQGIFADYVIIMGYDENTELPGPVASLGFVEKGITDTLIDVPKEKVINAVPFYTRVWVTDEDANVTFFACGMEEALGYLEAKEVTPIYGEDFGVNYGEYVSEIDGKYYQFWLEDKRAVEEKMKLIQLYELGGVASWKLGFENGIEVWELMNSYLQY